MGNWCQDQEGIQDVYQEEEQVFSQTRIDENVENTEDLILPSGVVIKV